MTFKRSLWLFAVMSLLFLTACPQPQPPVTVVIPDTTKVADSSTRDVLTSFDMASGDMHFAKMTPFLEALKTNDVLVSEPSEAAPYGYLRRVVDIHKDAKGVQLKTAVAGLADAINEGEFHAEGDFHADDLLATETYYPNITMGAIKQDELTTTNLLPGYDFFISFDQTLLDVNTKGVKVKVKVSGEVNLKSGYNVSSRIKPCKKLPPTCVEFTATMGFDENVKIAISGEANVKLGKEFKVGEFYFKPIILVVGVVPVVFQPTLAVYLGASGELNLKFEYGVSDRVVAQLGAKWNGKSWEDISAVDVQLKTLSEVNLDDAFNAELYVKPTSALLLYGVAGPTATLQPGLKMTASPNRDPFWQLDAVLKGSIGFGLELPLAGHLTNHEVELFNKTITLKKSPNLAPKITLFKNPAKADLGKPYYLLDLRPEGLCGAFFCVKDPEGGVLKVRLFSSLEGELPAGGEYSFKVEGMHAITITATDPLGNTTQAVLNLSVVNAPPDILFSYFDKTVAQGVPYFVNVSANDLNSGKLGCSSLRWSVQDPDVLTTELGASVGCNVNIIFGQMGQRSVNLSASDPQGAKTQKTLNVTVTEPPLIKPPGVGFMKIFNSRSGEVVQTGDKVRYGDLLNLSVAVTNPDNLPIEYSWYVSAGEKFEKIGDQPTMVWAAGYPIGEGSNVRILLHVYWGDPKHQPDQRLDFSVGVNGPR
ncbi:MAG: hypothetical protein KC422_24520 [Trueperaceae bacterium]|nr:hypothetical protein [Trueperaceae bacterium]